MPHGVDARAAASARGRSAWVRRVALIAGAACAASSEDKTLEQRIAEVAGWAPNTYKLEPMTEWDDPRVRILYAVRKAVRPELGATLAIFPDGSMVTSHDEGAFAKVAARVFQAPAAGDAAALPRLAVAFGAFGTPVGLWVDALPASAALGRTLPRSTAEVKLTTAGSERRFYFYTFDFERSALFDCEVRLGPDGASAAAVELRADAAAASRP